MLGLFTRKVSPNATKKQPSKQKSRKDASPKLTQQQQQPQQNTPQPNTSRPPKRARPNIDPLALAAVSTSKLHQQRHRPECDMRRVVLIRNLLHKVYQTWSSLLGRQVTVPAAGEDFEEFEEVEVVDIQRKENTLKRKKSLEKTGRRKMEVKVRGGKKKKDKPDIFDDIKSEISRDSGYSSDSSDEEDDDDWPNHRQSSRPPLQPGRKNVKHEQKPIPKEQDDDDDDEVPLGQLSIGNGNARPVSLSVPPVARPLPSPLARPLSLDLSKPRVLPARRQSLLRIITTSTDTEQDEGECKDEKPNVPSMSIRSITLMERLTQREQDKTKTCTPSTREKETDQRKEVQAPTMPTKTILQTPHPQHDPKLQVNNPHSEQDPTPINTTRQPEPAPILASRQSLPIPPPRRSSMPSLSTLYHSQPPKLEPSTTAPEFNSPPPRPEDFPRSASLINRPSSTILSTPPSKEQLPPLRKHASRPLMKSPFTRRMKEKHSQPSILYISTAVESGEWKSRAMVESPSPISMKTERSSITEDLSPGRESIDTSYSTFTTISQTTIQSLELSFSVGEFENFEKEVLGGLGLFGEENSQNTVEEGGKTSGTVRPKRMSFLENAFDLGWEVSL